ncbi:MAG: MotA/TolQ/ExbB proton channel family protein [Kiritimatiellae bacterium]|nr:MotA/TolQ/ExbB proton channel family protein [Kiritimatiellia bacterium]
MQSGDLGVGLSRALVTTITGLGIGLIGYFGHAFIVSRVSAVILEMEQAYAEILDFFADLDAAVKENAETEESAKEEQKEKLA